MQLRTMSGAETASILARDILTMILPLSKAGSFAMALKSSIATPDNAHHLIFSFDGVNYAYADEGHELMDFATAISQDITLDRKQAYKLLNQLTDVLDTEVIPSVVSQITNVPGATIAQKIHHEPAIVTKIIAALLMASTEYSETYLPEDSPKYEAVTPDVIDKVDIDPSSGEDTVEIPIMSATIATLYESLYLPTHIHIHLDTTLTRKFKLTDLKPTENQDDK